MLAASPFYHSVCGDVLLGRCHSAAMSGDDKNGGPNHLRAWREFRNLTQAELAEKVGTNQNMIGYLESGERGLSAKWLRKLAPVLNTGPGMLLDHDPANLSRDIVEIWLNADSREKRQIVDLAAAIVRSGTDG